MQKTKQIKNGSFCQGQYQLPKQNSRNLPLVLTNGKYSAEENGS